MRILLINIFYAPNIVGGAEISTQKLAEELNKTNEVCVLCNGIDRYIKDDVNGITVYRTKVVFEMKNPFIRVLTRNFKVQCYKQIKDIILEIQPDIIHTNNLHEFSPIVWKICHDIHIPIVHTIRDYSLLGNWKPNEKFVIKMCSRYVDAVTAPSQFTLNHFINKGMFKKAKYSLCIPNAIDYIYENTLKTINEKISRDRTIIKYAYIGRFSKEKGIDWLIKVFNELEIDAELHLFGEGKLTSYSEKSIGIDNRIIKHGFVSQEELVEQLKNIDVVVAPSQWDEPFGRIILDGFKCGCPVIVTKRGGMPEVVDNGINGLVVEDESDDSLKKALLFLYDKNNLIEMIPHTIGKLTRYSIEEQAKSFMALYNKTVGQENEV